MAEYKQYITQVQDNGKVMISEDVVATIVEHALTDLEGVAGLDTKPGADIADLIGKKPGQEASKFRLLRTTPCQSPAMWLFTTATAL